MKPEWMATQPGRTIPAVPAECEVQDAGDFLCQSSLAGISSFTALAH